MKTKTSTAATALPRLGRLALTVATCWAAAGSVQALEIPVGNSDVKVRWDNTLKYSAAWRLKDPSAKLLVDTNHDDGDRNFDKGLISSRVDLFSELDVVVHDRFGGRLSGAAWYDSVYNTGNDNDSDTANSFSVGAGKFPGATRDMMGRKAELLDAFVFLKNSPLDEQPYSIRLGRHTVLYGESLFFGANGIANAQAPMDMIKLLSVPGSQFKEIIRPVGQVSTQIQLTPEISFGAYYQYKWEKTRLPAAGSYLSDSDYVGAGAERFMFDPSSAGPAFFVTERRARDSGQGGVQFRFRTDHGVEYGLYAVRYHDRLPQLYVRPSTLPPAPEAGTGRLGDLELRYAENVKAFGASFSTVFGEANVAGEASVRTNAPLVSDPQLVVPGTAADGRRNPLYAVGKTAHAQLSMIYLMSENAIWDGAEFLGELAWNRRLSVDKNPAAIDPNTTRDAWALRFILAPQYFQVIPGLDLSVPIGLGYNFGGRSSAVFKFNGGTENAGDLSVGINFDYQKQIKGGLTFTHYLGSAGPFIEPANAFGAQTLSYKQSLKDRDFISFTIRTTF